MNTPSAASPGPRKTNCLVIPFHNDADHLYVLRAKKGDQNALTPLWHKYHPSLFDFFVRRTHNSEDAEDLASETLFAAFRQIHTFRGKSATDSHAAPGGRCPSLPSCTFRSYLFSIAHHQMARWIRRKMARPTTRFSELGVAEQTAQRPESLSDRLPADSGSDPLQILLSRERDEVAYHALADIGLRSDEQFKALLLHYACDLPHKEIAFLLRTPQKTINSRLQEAREAVRKRLFLAEQKASLLN